jgi:hypothetical protein
MILWQDGWGGNLGKAQKLLVILIGHFRRLVACLIRRAVGVSARRSGLTSRLLDTDCDDGRIEATSANKATWKPSVFSTAWPNAWCFCIP